MEQSDVKLFRHVVGVLRFLAIFRYDIAFATKILSEGLSKPLAWHMAGAKRTARYLKGETSLGHVVPQQWQSGLS